MDKENKKKTKWIVIFCVIAVFVFCLLFFRVQKVSVEGNTYYSQSVMSEMFQKNIFEKISLKFLDHGQTVVDTETGICQRI